MSVHSKALLSSRVSGDIAKDENAAQLLCNISTSICGTCTRPQHHGIQEMKNSKEEMWAQLTYTWAYIIYLIEFLIWKDLFSAFSPSFCRSSPFSVSSWPVLLLHLSLVFPSFFPLCPHPIFVLSSFFQGACNLVLRMLSISSGYKYKWSAFQVILQLLNFCSCKEITLVHYAPFLLRSSLAKDSSSGLYHLNWHLPLYSFSVLIMFIMRWHRLQPRVGAEYAWHCILHPPFLYLGNKMQESEKQHEDLLTLMLCGFLFLTPFLVPFWLSFLLV